MRNTLEVFKDSFLGKATKRAERKKVVVTGIGLVSPLGHSLQEFWSKLIEGQTGIDFIQSFDVSSFPCRIAAEVKSVRFQDYLSRMQIGYYPRATQLCCVAFAMAKADSGIDRFDAERTDVLIGSSSSAFEYIDKETSKNDVSRFGGFDPAGISKLNFNCTAAAIAAQENLKGYAGTLSTACASGITALGMAMERIHNGLAETVIVGATDVGVTRFLLNLFCAAKFVSFSDDPAAAVRPFDMRHTRSVLGDGACVFILQPEAAARKRKAKIYGRLAAFSQSYENTGTLFEVDKSGQRWSETILRAMERSPGNIDYVNAHGTGDALLDTVEFRALENAFAGKPAPVVSSIKGATGSPFAAAGAFQVVSTLLSLNTGIIPPSCGLETPFEQTKLPLVTRKAMERPIKRALVNSRGLGGINSSIICERIEG